MVCPIRTQRHSKSPRQQSTQVTNILLPSTFVSLSQIAKGVTGTAVGSDLPFSCQFALPLVCAVWASGTLVPPIRFPHLSPIRRARCLLRAGLSLFTFHPPPCAFAVPFFAFLALFCGYQGLPPITNHHSPITFFWPRYARSLQEFVPPLLAACESLLRTFNVTLRLSRWAPAQFIRQ